MNQNPRHIHEEAFATLAPGGRSGVIRRAPQPPDLDAPPGAGAWAASDLFHVDQFHPDGTDHRPATTARVLYDDEALFVQFDVDDRFVRAVQTEFQGPVCTDSCVEVFFWPAPALGYFNLEMNCGGTLLWQYYPDVAPPPPGQWRHRVQPTADEAAAIVRRTSLALPVEPELTVPTRWRLAVRLPFAALRPYIGDAAFPAPGAQWRMNLYKCGDRTSHPHWAAWSPIGEKLSFHQPAVFGMMTFG